MPLSTQEIIASITFTLEEAVPPSAAGWGDLSQGPNTISINLSDLDLDVWNWAWAYYVELSNAGTHGVPEGVEIDLTDLTDLAKTDFGFTAVLAIIVQVSGDCLVDVGPGDVHPFEAPWPSGPTRLDPTRLRTFMMTCDSDSVGVAVTGAHRTIKLMSAGEVTGGKTTAKVKVIIVGSTL